MADLGTIDYQGFREDLRQVSQNEYPKTALVKLPFNWYEEQASGLVSHAMNKGVLSLGTVTPGNQIAVFTMCGGGVFGVDTVTVTDSLGNTFTRLGGAYQQFNGAQLDLFLCTVTVGGPCFITTTPATSSPGVCEAIQVSGATGTPSFYCGYAPQTYNFTGGLFVAFAGVMGSTPYAWNITGPMNLLEQNIPNPNPLGCSSCWTQTTAGSLTIDPSITGWTGNSIPLATVNFQFSGSAGAYTPPPITPIPLPGPCNVLCLVSEAIDEQGEYQQSGLIGQQAAAGFIRFNGAGNVWFPISFVDPLTPGYVTTNDNYANTPLVGTGFSSIQCAFGVLDWRPAKPVLYSGSTPPTDPAGFLLAFVGVNLGVGAAVGAGDGSTYAIPSAAGPVERMKRAGVVK